MDWNALGLLDGLDDARARAARAALLDELHAQGVPLEGLRRAVAEDRLALLPVDLALSEEPRYSAREIAEASGLELEYFLMHRRALALPVAEPDERAYGEPDLEIARLARSYRAAGFPEEEALAVTRVLGQGMARYAGATRALLARAFLEAGTDELELGHRYEHVARELMPLATPYVGRVFALHLQQALRQDAISREEMLTGRLRQAQDVTIGFVDLVGFTEFGESVPVEELGGVAGRLSRLATDAVRPPVQIVKFIGDAVMLASSEPAEMVRTALALVNSADSDAIVPPLRAGLAHGPALNRWGDFFGSTVNVASRLTERAAPWLVLATEAVRDAAGEGIAWADAGMQELRGLPAPIRAFRAMRAPDG